MLDHRRPGRESPGSLTPANASASHYWLMRRTLQSIAAPAWPEPLQLTTLSRENAANVYELLRLCERDGGGPVSDFSSWWRGFEQDPECDPTLCLIVADHDGIVAVAQCWTSAFIHYVAVHPRARRQGIGRLLLEQAFAVFAWRNEGWLDLNVMENNLPARRLYEQAGMHYVRRSALSAD